MNIAKYLWCCNTEVSTTMFKEMEEESLRLSPQAYNLGVESTTEKEMAAGYEVPEALLFKIEM